MKKAQLNYSVIILFTVIVTLPILFVKLTTEIEDSKQTIGETQTAILITPYEKENIIIFLQKSAEQRLEKIKTQTLLELESTDCQQNLNDLFTQNFNKNLDVSVKEHNEKTFITIPLNNYETYIEKGKIHAIALTPINMPIKTQSTIEIGKIWFYPSFTIETNTDEIDTIIKQEIENCKKPRP